MDLVVQAQASTDWRARSASGGDGPNPDDGGGEARDRQRARLARSPDPIWLIGGDGLVEWVSPAVEGLLGYPRGELVSTNVFAVIHPEDQEPLADHCAQLLHGEGPVHRLRIRYRHAEGNWLTLEAEGEVTAGGPEHAGFLVVTRCLTTPASHPAVVVPGERRAAPSTPSR